jgi:hypothetical protein
MNEKREIEDGYPCVIWGDEQKESSIDLHVDLLVIHGSQFFYDHFCFWGTAQTPNRQFFGESKKRT